MSLPSFWAVAWFWQGLILTGETVQVLSQDHATFPKKMMFSLFSLDLKKKTWLGDDFNQFFVEMWYSATCPAILFAASLWACSMSINAKRRLDQLFFFAFLKINDLYILPPLFGESYEVKHIPSRKKMQNTTFILALSNFHNNWICLHYSPYCAPLNYYGILIWQVFFWENPKIPPTEITYCYIIFFPLFRKKQKHY